MKAVKGHEVLREKITNLMKIKRKGQENESEKERVTASGENEQNESSGAEGGSNSSQKFNSQDRGESEPNATTVVHLDKETKQTEEEEEEEDEEEMSGTTIIRGDEAKEIKQTQSTIFQEKVLIFAIIRFLLALLIKGVTALQNHVMKLESSTGPASENVADKVKLKEELTQNFQRWMVETKIALLEAVRKEIKDQQEQFLVTVKQTILETMSGSKKS